MAEPCYVPFEPGIGGEPVMKANHLVVRIVEKTPGVEAIRDDACLQWFREPEVENLLYLRTREPAEAPTHVAVMRDDRYLMVAFKCIEPEMKSAHRLVPRDAKKGQVEVFPEAMPRVLTYDECVGLYLGDKHDKTTYYQLQVNINGARRERHTTSAMSWTALPLTNWLELEGLKWESEVTEADDHWRAVIRVDLKSVGVDPPAGRSPSAGEGPAKQPTIGLNFARWRNVDFWKQYSWVPVIHLEHVPGIAMGDGYLHGDPVRVTQIDWGNLEHGRNHVEMTLLGNRQDTEVLLKVNARDREGLHGADYEAETRSKVVNVPSRDATTIEADFDLPFDHPGVLVTLELCEPDGKRVFYRATFPLRSHGNIRICQPYERAGKDASNPEPSEANFHERKRDFVLSRLPKFCRRTTAQGAPSDFVLMSRDGEVTFNLMEAGALGRIADWICTLFEEDNDRIVAVALLTNDDWVTVHASPRVGMQGHLTPLSMLRLGGGHCYSRAVIGAGIVSELPDPASGRKHEAWPVLVLGHVVTAVRRADDYVMIDPSFGHFFYNRDNTDLAVAKELEANPDLVTRVVKGKKRLINYASTAAQVRMDLGTIVWPAGGPPA